MSKKTGKGYPKGAVLGRTDLKDPDTGLWTTRDISEGQFMSKKKKDTTGSFEGIRSG